MKVARSPMLLTIAPAAHASVAIAVYAKSIGLEAPRSRV